MHTNHRRSQACDKSKRPRGKGRGMRDEARTQNRKIRHGWYPRWAALGHAPRNGNTDGHASPPRRKGYLD